MLERFVAHELERQARLRRQLDMGPEDERRLSRISSKTKGLARVEKLFVNVTGTLVEVGAPLAELYSPELYQATRELLLAQRTGWSATQAGT